MTSLFSNLCCRLGGYASWPVNGMRYLGHQGLMKPGKILPTTSEPSLLSRSVATLEHIMNRGIPVKRRKPKTPMLDGCPQKRGVILKVMIKKPKKPNSANRKCVRVRLTNGLEVNAYVPGVGHNLQEHGIVMVEGGRCRDLPAVKLRCVRGKYDLAKVKKKSDSL